MAMLAARNLHWSYQVLGRSIIVHREKLRTAEVNRQEAQHRVEATRTELQEAEEARATRTEALRTIAVPQLVEKSNELATAVASSPVFAPKTRRYFAMPQLSSVDLQDRDIFESAGDCSDTG